MMRLSIVITGAVFVCAVGVATSGSGSAQGPRQIPESPMAGIHWARGQAPARPGGGSPNLLYHGGPVMTGGAYVEPIYWGARWSDSAFVSS